MSLFCRFPVPFRCHFIGLFDTLAIGVHISYRILGKDIAIICQVHDFLFDLIQDFRSLMGIFWQGRCDFISCNGITRFIGLFIIIRCTFFIYRYHAISSSVILCQHIQRFGFSTCSRATNCFKGILCVICQKQLDSFLICR